MKQTNNDLLRKFGVMKYWMVGDLERTMFVARANFLVAQGLLNYTETIGSFLEPDGTAGKRFDAFFRRLGPSYEQLLKRFNGRRRSRPHVIYDDLRCGLAHEYVIKRKDFTVFNPGRKLSDDEILGQTLEINGVISEVSCGVVHANIDSRRTAWLIVNSRYWLDFRNGVETLWQELNRRESKILREKFFRRARQINFVRFAQLPQLRSRK